MNCPICGFETDENSINDHLDNCLNNNCKLKYIEPILTSAQNNALTYASKKAKIHSKQTRGLVLMNFIKMGYTENDLNEVLNYIKHTCDVTINCPTQILTKNIINSAHFKNGYEVQREEIYLKVRTKWENNLFDSAYTESEFIERPKYGALNLLKLKGGSVKEYGKSYLVLKQNVKNRITFVNGDSSLEMFHICTFNDIVALLIHLPNEYIKNIIKVAKENNVNITQHFNYVECQIHGMLRLNMDFEKLYLNEIECDKEEIKNVKKFCNDNKIEYNCL